MFRQRSLAAALAILLLGAFSLRAAEPSPPPAPALPPAEMGWGHLVVRFAYDGEPPEPEPLPVARDVMVCGAKPRFDESLLVDPETRGIANVVVWRESADDEEPAEPHPSYDMLPKVVEWRALDCRFEPRLLLLTTRQAVRVRNLDPIAHNWAVYPVANEMHNRLVPAGKDLADVRFPAAEPHPAPVRCGIHPWMQAYLVVRDSPYLAQSDARGWLVLPHLPAGQHELRVWHERTGWLSAPVDRPEFVDHGRLRVAIRSGETTDLGTVELSPEVFEN